MSESWQALVDRLFRERGRPMRGYIRRNTRSDADADDIFQDAYQRMRDAPNPETIMNPEGYLFRIVRNLLAERGRARREHPTADFDDPLYEWQIADMPDIAGEIDSEKRTARLRQVLKEMPARWQAAVKMCHMDGMTYEAAAVKLGVSVNSVKKYLKKAMAYCRRRMAEFRVMS